MAEDLASTDRPLATKRALIWDIPTRLFHWLLVGAILGAYLTDQFGGIDRTWHMRFGYAVLGLVLFRIVWGLVGSQPSRFASFIPGPRRLLDYLSHIGERQARPTATHNPMGALSVLALLAVVLFQAVTGLFVDDAILTQGPLASLVPGWVTSLATNIHAWNFNVLVALIVLHLAAIAFYHLYKRENLLGPMITGWKTLPASLVPQKPASLWLAGLVILLAAGLVYGIVTQVPVWLR
ncbi:MAG: cytochrome b/b6 domain-containing protein [Alphaproteobacteria bacterium]|nr:cytochrome b/b6 domain-containing protein [Alphaproteobacteria bacterium]